jgi:hypothetical protein
MNKNLFNNFPTQQNDSNCLISYSGYLYSSNDKLVTSPFQYYCHMQSKLKLLIKNTLVIKIVGDKMEVEFSDLYNLKKYLNFYLFCLIFLSCLYQSTYKNEIDENDWNNNIVKEEIVSLVSVNDTLNQWKELYFLDFFRFDNAYIKFIYMNIYDMFQSTIGDFVKNNNVNFKSQNNFFSQEVGKSITLFLNKISNQSRKIYKIRVQRKSLQIENVMEHFLINSKLKFLNDIIEEMNILDLILKGLQLNSKDDTPKTIESKADNFILTPMIGMVVSLVGIILYNKLR